MLNLTIGALLIGAVDMMGLVPALLVLMFILAICLEAFTWWWKR